MTLTSEITPAETSIAPLQIPPRIPSARLEKRSEPRLFIDEPATLHILQPAVGGRIAVRIMDMSQRGMGLRSTEPLPAGAIVHVRVRGTIVAMGQVRYSAGVVGEFYSGVQVEEVADCRSTWESD